MNVLEIAGYFIIIDAILFLVFLAGIIYAGFKLYEIVLPVLQREARKNYILSNNDEKWRKKVLFVLKSVRLECPNSNKALVLVAKQLSLNKSKDK